MRRLRRFAGLAAGERRLVVSAIVCLASVQMALGLLPWRAFPIITRVVRLCPATRSDQAGIVWAIRAASGVLPRTTCLARALTLQALLASHGLPSTIEIGVARDASGAFVSHAWVERDGVPLLETADGVAGYTRLPSSVF